jgi:hypothetical protein
MVTWWGEKEAHISKSISNKAVQMCCLKLSIRNNPCLEENTQIACLGDVWKPHPSSEFVPEVVVCESSLVHFEDPAPSHQQTLVLATFSAKSHQISNVLERTQCFSFHNIPESTLHDEFQDHKLKTTDHFLKPPSLS